MKIAEAIIYGLKKKPKHTPIACEAKRVIVVDVDEYYKYIHISKGDILTFSLICIVAAGLMLIWRYVP